MYIVKIPLHVEKYVEHILEEKFVLYNNVQNLHTQQAHYLLQKLENHSSYIKAKSLTPVKKALEKKISPIKKEIESITEIPAKERSKEQEQTKKKKAIQLKELRKQLKELVAESSALYKEAHGSIENALTNKRNFRNYVFKNYIFETSITKRLGSNIIQRVSDLVYQTVNMYLYNNKRQTNGKLRYGKPKFSPVHRNKTILNQAKKINLYYKNGFVHINTNLNRNKKNNLRSKIKIKALLDFNDIYHCFEQKDVKLTYLKKEHFNTVVRYFAIVLLDGDPPSPRKERKLGEAVVGIDINLQTIVLTINKDDNFSVKIISLNTIGGEKITRLEAEKKKIQSAYSRKIKALNPDAYEPDFIDKFGKLKRGKLKKGVRLSNRSKRLNKLRNKYISINRKFVEHRKSSHNILIKEILSLGNVFKIEDHNFISWNKLWHKAVTRCAPGGFVDQLKKQIEKTGGELILIDSKKAYSQTCICGNKVKKTLKDRWHNCNSCGLQAQRDILSSFLICIDEDGFDSNRAKSAWYNGMDRSHREEIETLMEIQRTNEKGFFPFSVGLSNAVLQPDNRVRSLKDLIEH